MNKIINLVIDFDDVIMNTGKLWEEAVSSLSQYGITKDLYLKTKIAESKNRNNSAFPYFLDNHLRILGIMLGKEKEISKIKSDIFLFLKKKSSQYIFPDVAPFLKEVKNVNPHTQKVATIRSRKNRLFVSGKENIKQGYENMSVGVNLTMLTYGEKELQSAKVYGSGVDKYFNKIIITQKPKWMSFDDILSDGNKTIFIDDKISELINVKNRFSEVLAARMKRKDGRYSKEESNFKFDYVVSDFNDLAKIISAKGELAFSGN